MTRFDASDPQSRRSLYVDAIAAHRDRGSQFVTIEVDENATAENPEAADLGVPWLQFAEGIVNLDCTGDELERLKSLLSEFPAFSIDELTRPEDAEGVNVRVSATADSDRIAQFLDRVIRIVYAFPETTRVWVVEL